ncbi:universal stress protein [Pontibacter sp. BT731]|uniref:universal stress protein n=1 Tax=Pontibacter coccineus TaxID=3063328 RepID=UPI0026E348E8|nr:universal stress protein [Pontibacter sp. BT731]MDO6391904.1 universal stress protein [Pontibacter sp. BT731]
MTPIDAMMVCLDLSDLDEKLVAFSRSVCERLQVRKVYFVHNIRLYELADDFREMIGDLDLSKEVEGNITDIVAEQFGNITDHEILVSEEPNSEVILADIVKRYGIKLTLLGKKISDRGTGALGTKLLRILPCSVLVFPETASFNIRKVLVPIDFSDTSLHALRLSKELSDQLGLELEIMHVYRLPTQFFPLISEEEAVQKALEVVKTRFADLQKRYPEIAGMPYTLVRAANKSIAERIALHLEKGRHDLLVLGLRGTNPLPMLNMGSVPTEVYNSDIDVPLWLVYAEGTIRK